MKLQYESGEREASKVTAQYDGRTTNLKVDENGQVEVETEVQAQALLENHGGFVKVDEDAEPDHVLAGKTVDEVGEYVGEIEDVNRLKELRELEERKTGKEVIDERIEEVKTGGESDDEVLEPDEE